MTVPFRDGVRVWMRVAALSFGGPAGQIAVMHRIVVEEKAWIDEARFLHALSYCMVLPGPEAQQLAIYLGWVLHGTVGGIVAGTLFVLPGLVSIMALSWVYALYGGVAAVAALFFGLKAAVLAIVLQALARVGSRALRNGPLRGVAAAAFAALFFFGLPFPAVVLGAGLLGWWRTRAGSARFRIGGSPAGDAAPIRPNPARGRTALRAVAIWLPLWLLPVAAVLLGGSPTFGHVALFFSGMAVVTFGGAYAVLAYVAQQAVEHYHWLRPGEMLDGLGMAETTPGPLIMVTQFVGFMAGYRDPGALSPLLAGTLAGLLTSWVTFTPCFLWIFLGAPYIEALRGNRALSGALSAITAAVAGVILNLAMWFALHSWFRELRPVRIRGLPVGLPVEWPVPASLDPWALALSLAAIVAVFRFRAGMAAVLMACAGTGLGLHLAGLI